MPSHPGPGLRGRTKALLGEEGLQEGGKRMVGEGRYEVPKQDRVGTTRELQRNPQTTNTAPPPSSCKYQLSRGASQSLGLLVKKCSLILQVPSETQPTGRRQDLQASSQQRELLQERLINAAQTFVDLLTRINSTGLGL